MMCVYVCVCAHEPQLLAHLSEFSLCLLFGVLLQYLTYSLVAMASSHF